jgi:hypothetical protein
MRFRIFQRNIDLSKKLISRRQCVNKAAVILKLQQNLISLVLTCTNLIAQIKLLIMRSFLKVFLTFICLIIFNYSTFAQQSNQSKIGLRFNNLFNTTERIDPTYSVTEFAPIASYTPQMSHGFEGAVFYKQAIGERWNIGFGFIGGVYASRHELYFNSEFIEGERIFETEIKRDFDYEYGGMNLSVEYALFTFDKSRLSLHAGLSYLFFVPYELGIRRSIEGVKYFESSKIIAPDQNGLITPEGGLSYSYTFWQRLAVSAMATVRYSDTIIADGEYRIIGDNDQLFGFFEQDLLSFNLGIELAYCFKK